MRLRTDDDNHGCAKLPRLPLWSRVSCVPINLQERMGVHLQNGRMDLALLIRSNLPWRVECALWFLQLIFIATTMLADDPNDARAVFEPNQVTGHPRHWWQCSFL